jgi:hypothetical protein
MRLLHLLFHCFILLMHVHSDITRTLCERPTSMILLAVQRSISPLPFPFSTSDSSFGWIWLQYQKCRYGSMVLDAHHRSAPPNSGTKRRPCILLIVHQRLHVCCMFVSFIPVWVWLKHAIPYAPHHRGFTMVSSHVTLPSLKPAPGWPESNRCHPNRCASPNCECEPKVGIYTQLRYSYLEPRTRGHIDIYI